MQISRSFVMGNTGTNTAFSKFALLWQKKKKKIDYVGVQHASMKTFLSDF